MRLRQIRLQAYRSFMDQRLELDPYATAIVGRNDSGKTSLLNRFFDQYVYEHAVHSGDRPLVEGPGDRHVGFTLLWDIDLSDYSVFPFPVAFQPPARRRFEVTFQHFDGPSEDWIYRLDGQRLAIYSDRSPDTGWPVLRDEFNLRQLIPRPHYVSVSRTSASMFEMHLFALADGWVRSIPHAKPDDPARLLLAVGGMNAITRPVTGIEELWPQLPHTRRSEHTLEQVESQLALLSERLTTKMQRWWNDPPGLRVSVRLAGNADSKRRQHHINSYIVVRDISGTHGPGYSGEGILWFLSFLVELLFLEDQPSPLLLLFDEPGSPLHPSAQRAVAKLLTVLAQKHQVIYSTHSPFMIDWNFPQRIRLFRRDADTGRTTIDNTPYAGKGAHRVWDPLRDTLGVSLGDIGVIGEHNILVEGIADQLLLANASAQLEALGRSHLDLAQVAIVPFGSDLVILRGLLNTAKRLGATACILADSDSSGNGFVKEGLKQRVDGLQVAAYVDPVSKDASIEDMVGTTEYVVAVNEAYSGFDWFRPFDPTTIQAACGTLSLGSYFEREFSSRFDQNFSKVSVALLLIGRPTFEEPTLARFEALIGGMLGAMQRGNRNQ